MVGVGRPLANVGMTATAGVGSFKHPPKNYEEMHPGAYDAKARLKYMDEMGICMAKDASRRLREKHDLDMPREQKLGSAIASA